MHKSLLTVMLYVALASTAFCAKAQIDIESFQKSNRHWSLGIGAGLARQPVAVGPNIETINYQDGSVYTLTHQVQAGMHTHFNYGEQYPVNRWLHAKWLFSASIFQLGYRLDANLDRPVHAPPPNFPLPEEFSNLSFTPIFSLGLIPGMVAYVPLSQRWWWMNGAMFGPLLQAGDVANSPWQVYDYAPKHVHFRWQALLETGLEFQPFKGHDKMKLFGTFQFLQLGGGNRSGYWQHYTHFGQIQLGMRVKG